MILMMIVAYTVNIMVDIVSKACLVYVVAFAAHRGWQAGKKGK